MPGIIDTHNHLSQTREMLIERPEASRVLRRAAAQSMGQDTTNISFQIREETRDNKFRVRRASSPPAAASPASNLGGRWAALGLEPAEDARRRRGSRQKVDLIKIWSTIGWDGEEADARHLRCGH